MKYILIIMLMGNGSSVQKIEFESELLCETARLRVQTEFADLDAMYWKYDIRMICVPKGID